MKDKTAFWDASAVVPLCCVDKHSQRARFLSRQYPQMIVWWNTRVEIRSALCRFVREGNLDEKGFKQALKLVGKMRDRWSVILPTDVLADLAENCLDRYRLRAADAMQLSAALVWCREKPARRAFITFDPGLATAARELGFDVHGMVEE